MNTCYIICAGDAGKINIKKEKNDYIIAADAGLFYCERNGITPDLILGDFDSLGYIPTGNNVVALPVQKDDTDAFAAVKEGLKRGCERFIFYGACGGKRQEHTYANISLTAYLSKIGKRAFLDCGSSTVTAVTDGSVSFPSRMKGDISVFSFDNESAGVTETGLMYALDNAVMKNITVTGISNSFIGQPSRITVKNGTLIIFYSGSPNDAEFNSDI